MYFILLYFWLHTGDGMMYSMYCNSSKNLIMVTVCNEPTNTLNSHRFRDVVNIYLCSTAVCNFQILS